MPKTPNTSPDPGVTGYQCSYKDDHGSSKNNSDILSFDISSAFELT